MPKPYSYDLRMRIIYAVERGEQISKISRIYNVSRETIYQWARLKQVTGDIKAKSGYQKGVNNKIKNLDNFKSFVAENKDKTGIEMAKLWGTDISSATIYRYLQKINFSRKKRHIFIKSEMK